MIDFNRSRAVERIVAGILGGEGEVGGVGRIRRSVLWASMRSLSGAEEDECRERLDSVVSRGGRSLRSISERIWA